MLNAPLREIIKLRMKYYLNLMVHVACSPKMLRKSDEIFKERALSPVNEDIERAVASELHAPGDRVEELSVDARVEMPIRAPGAANKAGTRQQRLEAAGLTRRSTVSRNFQEEHLLQLLGNVRPPGSSFLISISHLNVLCSESIFKNDLGTTSSFTFFSMSRNWGTSSHV